MVLIAFVSLAVDFGRLRLVREQLQTSADAASMAGARALPLSSQAVIDDAIDVALQNHVLDDDRTHNYRTDPGVQLNANEDVIFGIWDPKNETFTPLADQGDTEQDERRAANAVQAYARRLDERENPVKLIFAPVLGVFSKQEQRDAICYITNGPKNFGFVGIDAVNSNGNYAYIDSSVYGMNGTGGGVASNGNIDLGNGDVYGDTRAGGNLYQGPNSLATGWTATLDYKLSYPADVYSPPIPLTSSTTGISPANMYNTNSHVFDGVNGNSTGSINAGTYRFSKWKDSGQGTLTVNGPATFYIDGDFTMDGSSTLKINGTNGPVRFFINGNFKATGGNIINTGSASNLYISMTGNNTMLDYKGTVDSAAHIYAPLTKVTISGTPGFTGWIIGKELNFKGTSKLHYDETGKDTTAYAMHLVK
jgi:hypothetical protein